jgi:steroid delta-isomerase-like uncharacterized protein
MDIDVKTIIKRLFDEVINGRDLDVLDEIVSDDYVDYSPVPGLPAGRAGVKAKLEGFYAAFPDMEFVLEDLVAEGGTAAARWHWEGTQKGAFMGIDPTDRKVSVKGMDFYRVSEGRIKEHWDNVDTLSLLQQLGVKP